MFRPFTFYIGLRYTRAKRRNHFISISSSISMLGIALGVMVLITVLSVMNGFDFEIRNRIFSLARQVSVTETQQGMQDWEGLSRVLAKQKNVKAVAPYVTAQGILKNEGVVRPVVITGITPQGESKISDLQKKFVAGALNNLQPGEFGIAIGESLAQLLNLQLGDKVLLLTPKLTVTPAAVLPRYKRFKVVGIFHAGKGFGFDTNWAFINLRDGQKLFELGDRVTGLSLKLTDLYKAPAVVQQLAKILTSNYWISDWTQDYGSLFHAIAMEKTMMFFILLLIIAVAVFNLISTLVMVVTDKQADIAILRTLGASPRTILGIFMVQGLFVGVIGTFLGLIAGLLLATHVTEITTFLQTHLNIQLFSSDAYYLDYLPSQLDKMDVIKICSAALILSLIATLYPAWRAAKVQPAEALRYE